MITIPAHGESFLSKVLDEGSATPIREHAIDKADFSTATERDAYEFITGYAKENGGKTPDYRTVVERFPDFYYREGVTDEYRYLAKEIKSYSAKRAISDMFAGNPDLAGKPTQATVEDLVNKKDGNIALEDLISSLESIKLRTSVRESVGTDLKVDTVGFLDEYRRRKTGESFRIWKSKFSGINSAIGGYYSGNTYAWYGKSGRGKSVFVMEDGAIEPAFQGANVLVWAREMSKFEWMARAYASISARRGCLSATIDGQDYEVGFENRGLVSGGLSEEFEKGFEDFLANIGDIMPGNIKVRAIDDADFIKADVKQLESDIIQTEADVVVIDPIYLMDFEKNNSRTAGGDVAETSKKIRALAGRTHTVIHVVTQAEETSTETNDDGSRILEPPKRADVKKSKQILEDAFNLFGIDTADSRFIIEIGKGRNGGEGVQVEGVYLPNYGVVKELSLDDAF